MRMPWCKKEDTTKAIITAKRNMQSSHHDVKMIQKLPEIAILFFIGKAIPYVLRTYECDELSAKFPRFLNPCPIYRFKNMEACFLDGGRGAPQAADTLETLAELGVKTIISVGMIGAFHPAFHVGDILIPSHALAEEGTSHHYYEDLIFAYPAHPLWEELKNLLPQAKSEPIVSCDTIYRQTLRKEEQWRRQGCVGVDMETSAIMSIGNYRHLQTAAILMVSDVHSHETEHCAWEWKVTDAMREAFTRTCISCVQRLSSDKEIMK